MISEAVKEMFTQELRELYLRRLENDAYLFKLKGIHEESEMALYHAAELKKDTPACDLPFVQEIFRRTFEPHFIRYLTDDPDTGMRIVYLGSNPDLELFRE